MWLLKFKWHRWRRSSKTYGTHKAVESSRKSHCELPKWIYIKLSNGIGSHCSVNSNRYDTVWFRFVLPSGCSSYLFPFRENKNRLHARQMSPSSSHTFSRYAFNNCKPSLYLLTLDYQRKTTTRQWTNLTVEKEEADKIKEKHSSEMN